MNNQLIEQCKNISDDTNPCKILSQNQSLGASHVLLKTLLPILRNIKVPMLMHLGLQQNWFMLMKQLLSTPCKLDYSHVGKMLYFDAQGNTVETDPSWWYRFLEGVKGVFADLGSLGPDSFKDHYMDAYLSRLQRHINDKPYP